MEEKLENHQPENSNTPAEDPAEAIDKAWQEIRGEDQMKAGEAARPEKENTAAEPSKSAETQTEEPTNELSPEKLAARREKVERNNAEKYGEDKSSGKWKIAKNIAGSLVNSVGSVFGARAAWEAPKLVYNYFKKKGQREKLSDVTMDILEEAQKTEKVSISNKEVSAEAEKIKKERENGVILWSETDNMLRSGSTEANDFMKQCRKEAVKRLRKEKNAEHIKGRESETKEDVGKGPVFTKIKELNEKLKEVKIPPDEKKALREKMADILKEYRHQKKELADVKTEKLGKLLDTYINNKAQALLTAKEALNTAAIMVGAPILRAGAYGAFSIAERWRKLSDQYDKKGGEKGESKTRFISKGMTVNAAKEMIHGLTLGLLDKEKKGAVKRSAEFASSVGTILRFAGLAEYEYAMLSGKISAEETARKLYDDISNGNVSLGQGLHNWADNTERVLGRFGIHLPSTLTDKAENVLGHFGIHLPTRHTAQIGSADYEDARHWTRERPADALTRQSENIKPGHIIPGAPIPTKEAYLPPDWLDTAPRLAGENKAGVLEALASHPELREKLDDPLIQNILAKNSLSKEHIESLLSAKEIHSINKPGGSISEALEKAMVPDAKVTVINPDGSILKNFDANLVHKGDVAVLNENGEITVIKASGITAKAGQSLEGIYKAIGAELDKAGVPKEVRDEFNHGSGYWGEKVTRAEARDMLDWWHKHRDAYGQMTREQQQQLLHNVVAGQTEPEIKQVLSGAPPIATTTNIEEQFKNENAGKLLHDFRREDVSYGGEELRQREELSQHLNELRRDSGFQPRDNETVGEYIKRNSDFAREQNELKESLRATPEALPQNWPPPSGQTGSERLAFNPYSDMVAKGGEFGAIKAGDNIKLGANQAVIGHITEIFGAKKSNFSSAQELDNIPAWKEIKDKTAADIISGQFGKTTWWSRWFSGQRRQQNEGLRKYLKDLKDNQNVAPTAKETVENYVKRAEEWLSRKKSFNKEY